MGEWTLLGEALDYAVLGRTDGQVYIAPMALLDEEPRGSKILPVTHRRVSIPKPNTEVSPEERARLWTWWIEMLERLGEETEGELLPPPMPPMFVSDTYEIEDHEFLIASKLKVVVRATYAEDYDVWLLRGIHVSQKKKEARLSEGEQRRNARPEIRKPGGLYRE